jgi:UDP-N-acetylglucosamine 2-epimerase (non-hydrolysing)
LIKLSPLVPLLDDRFEHRYVFSGQHYSPSMVDELFGDHEAPAPDSSLQTRSSDPETLRAALLTALCEEEPDLVLVYGDTNSTLAAAQAAREVGAILIHIEAGVRSFDRTMVEERNRVEVDRLADLRLAPTPLSHWFLTHIEGFEARGCPVVGNLVVDAWQRFSGEDPSGCDLQPDAGARSTALLTLHRPDTVDQPLRLQRLLDELGTLPMDVLFAIHPRTRKQIETLAVPGNIEMLPALPYPSFCRLLRKVSVVLTDSGGVQEEAATAGRPCVTLRPNTDRPESVLLGTNLLYPPNCERRLQDVVRQTIADAAGLNSSVDRRILGPYGDGQTAERITVLLELLDGRSPSFDLHGGRGFCGRLELEEAARFIENRPRHLRVVG